MIDKKTTEFLKDKLVEAYSPCAIYLFGSYAWGIPNKDSDIDLMVVIDDETQLEQPESFKGYMALADLNYSKDIVIIKKGNFIKRSLHPSTLQHKILHDGIKLYGNI